MIVVTRDINGKPISGEDIEKDNAVRMEAYNEFAERTGLRDDMLDPKKWLMRSYTFGINMRTPDEAIESLARAKKCSVEYILESKKTMDFIKDYNLWYLK
jgi:hypothetical protein